ncbi:hypothetical protein [Shimia sp.]|mgnify:CR=1 FL=1|jgi:hypothetical protein|uniref:hypothetical protein n=1 Tax=unclassified Shimia TaxID=2630038 RepID=UPI0025F53A47|nr:hypothetical protein [Shimia sp.]MCH2065787.1 hypothetical protein [Shimia sp.]
MAFSILTLDTGNLSLEFAESDIPRLQAEIQNSFGDLISMPHIMHDDVTFGGLKFLFYNEWDDPCLISQCHEGAAVLKQLADKLRS